MTTLAWSAFIRTSRANSSGERRAISSENGSNSAAVYAFPDSHTAQALADGCDQFGGALRICEDARAMRMRSCENYGDEIVRTGECRNLPQDLAMTHVDTVEVADRDYRRAEAGAEFRIAKIRKAFMLALKLFRFRDRRRRDGFPAEAWLRSRRAGCRGTCE